MADPSPSARDVTPNSAGRMAGPLRVPCGPSGGLAVCDGMRDCDAGDDELDCPERSTHALHA